MLKPRHVSVTQDHLQRVNRIKRKFYNSYIYIYIFFYLYKIKYAKYPCYKRFMLCACHAVLYVVSCDLGVREIEFCYFGGALGGWSPEHANLGTSHLLLHVLLSLIAAVSESVKLPITLSTQGIREKIKWESANVTPPTSTWSFRPEDGSSRLLRNSGNQLQDYTVITHNVNLHLHENLISRTVGVGFDAGLGKVLVSVFLRLQ
jgi:hypothetical protein